MSSKALSVNHLSVSVGGRELLTDIKFSLEPGELVLLLGSNGAGKSTLIRTILGELRPDSGSVSVGRVALIAQDPRQSTYGDLTIAEHCRLVTSKDCRTHLAKFMPRFIEMLDRPVSLLSGGERQVLALALCLLDPPDLLLLDEHTSALDPKTADRVMQMTLQFVQEAGIAVLMTTHNVDQALSCQSRILALKSGQIPFDGRVTDRRQLLEVCYD